MEESKLSWNHYQKKRQQHQKEMLDIFETEKQNLVFAHPDMRDYDYRTLIKASLLYFRQGDKARARDIRRKLLKIMVKNFQICSTREEYDSVLLVCDESRTICLFADLEYEMKMLKKIIDIAKEQEDFQHVL